MFYTNFDVILCQFNIMAKKWWIFPALFVGYVLYQKFVLSRTFNVVFKDLDFSSMSLLSPTVNIVVQVSNPTPITAEIQQIRGVLYVDGQEVGNVLGIAPTVLRSGSSELKIPITLSYMGVTQLIQKYKSLNFRYNFEGTMIVDYISIPLKFGYPTING